MIDWSVPMRISLWSGTGTVIVESAVFFCMTTWLPRRRTSRNPCVASSAQSSPPEKTRSLPSPDLQRGDEDLAVHPGGYFRGIGGFEEKLDRLTEIRRCVLDGIALTGN